MEVQLPAPGLAYLALPIIAGDPARGQNASSEAAGINSAGVAVSATESIYNSAPALGADPYVEETGVVEDSIPSLLLPQATSARKAASLLGSLVSALGAGEGLGVLMADAEEAWYLETASGHHWLAQRVPHDSFFVSGNQGRFQEVNLSDAGGVMFSPGLEDFAIRAGLYNPTQGHPLNFFQAFMDPEPTQRTYSYPRVRRLQQMYGGGGARWPGAEEGSWEREGVGAHPRPVFMRPNHPLEAAEVMEGLRDRFQGSHHDPYEPQMNPKEMYRPIAVLRSGNGHVIRLRPASLVGGPGKDSQGVSSDTLPGPLRAINYVAWGMPALSPFIPIYGGLPGGALPPQLTDVTSQPDAVSIFWKVRRLQALAFQDWPTVEPGAGAAIRAFEADVESRQRPAFERRYMAELASGAGEEGEAAAGKLLAAFTADVVEQAGDLLDGLIKQAAQALGWEAVPSDDAIVEMLEQAIEEYGFEPPYASAAVKAGAATAARGWWAAVQGAVAASGADDAVLAAW